MSRLGPGIVRALTPPERYRRGPFREGAFGSTVRDRRLGAILGIALGISFAVCFLTGLLSHLIQRPPGWFGWPPRPAGLYRVTQGVHVATGFASIPLLLAKLWVVYPRLWTWPPVRGLGHLVERASLLPLVGGALFVTFSGVASISRWFPWPFSFPPAHHAAAWVTMGGLVVHVGAKAAVTRAALHRERGRGDGSDPATRTGLSRRGFLGAVAAATGTLTVATVGQTIRPLAGLSVLAPRDPRVGPQGFPVNKSARSANVSGAALDPAYRLEVVGRVARPLSLSPEDLVAMTRRDAELPIACVDGWSASARWSGVAVRELLTLAGAERGAAVRVVSMQPRGPYRVSILSPDQALDPDALLADRLNGEPLHLDHGFPLRLIAPNRPGVLQTKWVRRVEVVAL